MTTPYVEDDIGHIFKAGALSQARTNSRGNPVKSCDEVSVLRGFVVLHMYLNAHCSCVQWDPYRVVAIVSLP